MGAPSAPGISASDASQSADSHLDVSDSELISSHDSTASLLSSSSRSVASSDSESKTKADSKFHSSPGFLYSLDWFGLSLLIVLSITPMLAYSALSSSHRALFNFPSVVTLDLSFPSRILWFLDSFFVRSLILAFFHLPLQILHFSLRPFSLRLSSPPHLSLKKSFFTYPFFLFLSIFIISFISLLFHSFYLFTFGVPFHLNALHSLVYWADQPVLPDPDALLSPMRDCFSATSAALTSSNAPLSSLMEVEYTHGPISAWSLVTTRTRIAKPSLVTDKLFGDYLAGVSFGFLMELGSFLLVSFIPAIQNARQQFSLASSSDSSSRISKSKSSSNVGRSGFPLQILLIGSSVSLLICWTFFSHAFHFSSSDSIFLPPNTASFLMILSSLFPSFLLPSSNSPFLSACAVATSTQLTPFNTNQYCSPFDSYDSPSSCYYPIEPITTEFYESLFDFDSRTPPESPSSKDSLIEDIQQYFNQIKSEEILVQSNATRLSRQLLSDLAREAARAPMLKNVGVMSKQKMCVLIGFRPHFIKDAMKPLENDWRTENLEIALKHLARYLSLTGFHQLGLTYELIVVEMAYSMKGKSLPFNRAAIFNAGLHLLLESQRARHGCTYVVIHDADQLPLNAQLNPYLPPEHPTHLCSAVSQFDFTLLYKQMFGGVVASSAEQLQQFNGFDNDYWGWGGEDDDLRLRLHYSGLATQRLKAIPGAYRSLGHSDRTQKATTELTPAELYVGNPDVWRQNTFDLLQSHLHDYAVKPKQIQTDNGYKQVQYRVLESNVLIANSLTHYLIDLNPQLQKFMDSRRGRGKSQQ